MPIEEFYEVIGGDYEEIVHRMMGETRVKKYIKKFPENTTYSKLYENMNNKDYGNAFLEVHNLKGMSMNIGVTELAEVCSELTEALRDGPKGDVEGLFEAVKLTYEKIVGLIQSIEE